jgi:flagellar hook-associated protein 3 FlgL
MGGVSDLSLFSSLAFGLDSATSNLQQVEDQLATGKSVNQPSDNPAAYASAQVLNAQESAVSNDLVLGQQVQSQLTTASNALSDVSTSIDSAISVATQGADSSISTSEMATLGSQVQSILQQVIGAANSQYGGSYLFAGNQVQAPPYDANGNYSGDSGSNSVTFSDGTQVQTNLDGSAVFGNATSGLIGTLTSLESALDSGNKTAVAAALPELQTNLAGIAAANGNLGISLSSVSTLLSNATSQSTTLQSSISNLVDADVPQVAAQEQEALLQQQALVSLGSGLNNLPLVNILA